MNGCRDQLFLHRTSFVPHPLYRCGVRYDRNRHWYRVSRSGCRVTVVQPPCDVRYIFAHDAITMVGCNAPRVVETLAHACVHVMFSISHCAPQQQCDVKQSILDIGISLRNPICGVKPPLYNAALWGNTSAHVGTVTNCTATRPEADSVALPSASSS